MPDGRDVVYLYDRTFDGLLCCVFESYIRREVPLDILPDDTPQLPLYGVREIVTTQEGAQRVFLSLAKLGSAANEMIEHAFLNGDTGKEMAIFQLIRLGYRVGPRVSDMLGDAVVSHVYKLAFAATHEAHLITGFLRFSDYSGRLVAVIEPKHFVLPLIQPHFCTRFCSESFFIYDKTHGMALVYEPRRACIFPVDEFFLPQADETELQFRRLWKQYFETIAIESRRNPVCQRSHMPKRFWKHLTEMQQIPQPKQGAVTRLP